MNKLRLGPILDEKPVKMTIELPATLHHNLTKYAQILAREIGSSTIEPSRLVAPMLDRFMKGDKAFLKAMKQKTSRDV
jgi:hypothetical protein